MRIKNLFLAAFLSLAATAHTSARITALLVPARAQKQLVKSTLNNSQGLVVGTVQTLSAELGALRKALPRQLKQLAHGELDTLAAKALLKRVQAQVNALLGKVKRARKASLVLTGFFFFSTLGRVRDRQLAYLVRLQHLLAS